MHFTTTTILATLAATASAAKAGRTFAVNHFYGKGPLMMGRVDPIVSPGVAAGHVHAIQGGNAFGLTMTDTQALGSTCTSSRVKADKSNYWTPALYFKDPKTGELEAVEMFYMNVYYFFEKTNDEIKAFPPGLRMLIGNPSLRTPPSTGGRSIHDLADGVPQPIQWTCPRKNDNDPLYPVGSDGLHGVGIQDPNNRGSGVGFPDKNCDGYASPLRADIHFPSCYNPAAGLDNYKENMQYPTNGDCPSGWIHVPHMFYEVYWNTPKFADRWTQGQGSQPFVLSNGDPTGYSLHGDFISGWEVDALQQMIDNCDAGDAGMDKCPGLIGGLNDPSTSCNLDSPIQETISGLLNLLPGNNPIGQWGVNAAAPAANPPASTAASQPASSQPAVNKPVSSQPAAANSPTTAKAAAPQTTSTRPPVVKTGGDSNPAASSIVPTSAPSPTGAVTMITSYVSETTVVWTTVTADAPAPSGSSSPVKSGWSYKGCFVDTKDRVLTGIKLANVGQHAATNTKCVDYCDARGFSMAGTEYGGQCFCGNQLEGSSKADEATCNMPCEGDDKQICGGGNRLSVYSKGGVAKRANRHMHRHVREISH